MDSIQGLHVMTLANSIIGVSILAMPYCFKQCGIILSIVLLLFSSVLSRLSCHFLIKSSIKAKLKTFENLAFYTFGPLGKFAVEIGLIGFLIGTCIAFFVVMGDLGPQIVAQLTETHATSQLRTLILVSLAIFCVLPLGLLRNVESLGGVCTAAIGFYACLVLKIISESAPHIASGDWIGNVDFWNPSGILQCIPIFSMALFCQTQLFEIYQSMSNASLDKMNAVVRLATHICTCVYIFVGVFGYIAVAGHGAPIGGNILLAFRPSLITEIIKIGFVLSVAFSFPLVIFPCRASIYSLLYKSSYSLLDTNNVATNSAPTSPSTIYIPVNKFRTITVIIVAVSLLIGIIIPNIELVLGLVGSTIGVMICVIFPATSFICLTTKNTNERIGAQIILCIGVLIMVLGSYANLYAIEEVAINPIDAVKPIQIENVAPLESVINSFEEKHKDDLPNLDVEKVINDIKLNDINNKISNDQENEKNANIIEKIDKILEPKEDENLNEIRHEPVQPEEPIEEPKKVEVKEPEKISEEKNIEKVIKNITIEKSEIESGHKVEKSEGKIKLDTNIDVEAIKKEDAEELEQKKKEILQEAKKNEAILVNLQKQNELQQEMVEEQKKILGELKELKKIAETQQKPQIEQTAEKSKLKDDSVHVIPEFPEKINEVDKINDKVIVKKGAVVKNRSVETVLNNQEMMKNNNEIVIANEAAEMIASNQKESQNKIEIKQPIKVNEKNEISNKNEGIVEEPVEEKQQNVIKNDIEQSAKKPIEDTVLRMLENQMKENKRENNQTKNENKITASVENPLQNNTRSKDNDANAKENHKFVEREKENVNAIRRDILSAGEMSRVKRDIQDGNTNAMQNELDNSEKIDDRKEHCSNSSSSNMIVRKDDHTRYEGKFVARELKSVSSDSDNDNP